MRRLISGLAACVIFLATLVTLTSPIAANAAVSNQFNPGYIISDQNFFEGTSMSPMDVARFIDSKSGVCRAGYTCLKDYLQAVPNMSPEAGLCNGYSAHPLQSAAEIISRVASSCGISAKVLIVLLEKEQSLVTDTWPLTTQYTRATGFACPDTAPCDPSYGGFFYQVYNGARQLRNYGVAPERWNYRAGQLAPINYHPNASCGSSNVNIRNRATAALYNYTPYQPNAAALANLYGSGDACSAYGNRNFWRLYTDWFGPTTAPVGTPEGEVTVTGTYSGIQLSGWAVDPDSSSSSVVIAVQIGSVWRQSFANSSGADLSTTYAGAGATHGISAVFPFSEGDYPVCVYLVNAGGVGAMGDLGCRTVNVPAPPAPVLSIDAVTATAGHIDISGWAVRPDSLTAGVNIAINVGNRWIQATGGQPNLNAPVQISGAGQSQGFVAGFDVSPGQQSFCVWGNKSNGAAVMLGCRDVLVPEARTTSGQIESVSVSGNNVTISGWAVWPDALSATVHLAANVGDSWTSISANQANPNANAAVPGAGSNHGFTATIAVPAGVRSICIWTTQQSQSPSILGCRTVVLGVPAPSLVASVDSVSGSPGKINFNGWAVWPNNDSSTVRVAANVGNQWFPVDANTTSNSIQQSVNGVSQQHGFSGSVNVSPGNREICFWAAQPNAPAKFLECRSVVVQDPGTTSGELVNITGGAGGIHVDGWAVRQDQPTASVRLAVNIGSQWFPLDTGYANNVAPMRVVGAGANQGFNALVPISPGNYDACVWAAGASKAVMLGCSSVTVSATPSLSAKISEMTPVSGGIRVSGWAVWPSSPTQSVNVAANIGSSWSSLTRGIANPLVPGYVLGAGGNQGFSSIVPAQSGPQTICIWASNAAGPASLLGCRNLTVP